MGRFTLPAWAISARSGVLPIAILMLVMLMIVPVPAVLLDIGFIANIVISMAVLMVALNAAKPLDFSAFPTVLLLATIARLALNVASTRVVLVHGHEGPAAAGHVIEAFGNFLIEQGEQHLLAHDTPLLAPVLAAPPRLFPMLTRRLVAATSCLLLAALAPLADRKSVV